MQDIINYLNNLEYLKENQERSGNPYDYNHWRKKIWNLENDYSDAEEVRRMNFNKSLNERFNQIRNSVSTIHSDIKKLKEDFNNRFLNIENYIIDKDVDRIIPNLAVLSSDIKIERVRDYNVPVIEMCRYNSLDDLSDLINKSNIFPLDIFYLLRYKGKYYRYSNLISPLDYIFSDIPCINDYRSLYICRHNLYGGKGVLFITKGDKHYMTKGDYRGDFKDLCNIDPFNDLSIYADIDLETKKFKIDTYELTHKIYEVLDESVVNRFNKPFMVEGFKIKFVMDYNGDGELLPVLSISKDDVNLFRGNLYNNEIVIRGVNNLTSLNILKKILKKIDKTRI